MDRNQKYVVPQLLTLTCPSKVRGLVVPMPQNLEGLCSERKRTNQGGYLQIRLHSYYSLQVQSGWWVFGVQWKKNALSQSYWYHRYYITHLCWYDLQNYWNLHADYLHVVCILPNMVICLTTGIQQGAELDIRVRCSLDAPRTLLCRRKRLIHFCCDIAFV